MSFFEQQQLFFFFAVLLNSVRLLDGLISIQQAGRVGQAAAELMELLVVARAVQCDHASVWLDLRPAAPRVSARPVIVLVALFSGCCLVGWRVVVVICGSWRGGCGACAMHS